MALQVHCSSIWDCKKKGRLDSYDRKNSYQLWQLLVAPNVIMFAILKCSEGLKYTFWYHFVGLIGMGIFFKITPHRV